MKSALTPILNNKPRAKMIVNLDSLDIEPSDSNVYEEASESFAESEQLKKGTALADESLEISVDGKGDTQIVFNIGVGF